MTLPSSPLLGTLEAVYKSFISRCNSSKLMICHSFKLPEKSCVLVCKTLLSCSFWSAGKPLCEAVTLQKYFISSEMKTHVNGFKSKYIQFIVYWILPISETLKQRTWKISLREVFKESPRDHDNLSHLKGFCHKKYFLVYNRTQNIMRENYFFNFPITLTNQEISAFKYTVFQQSSTSTAIL